MVRVATFALTPSIVVAMVLTVKFLIATELRPEEIQYIVPVWMMLYGTGVYTAGLFSVRAPRVLGLTFMAFGIVSLMALQQYGVITAPLPRRDLMNQRGYLIRHTMVTSRGCPHSCDFCYKSSFWGPTYYEQRPMAEIERELAMVDDGLVFFLDDNLLANRRHARAMFEVLRGSGIVWQASASLDVIRDPGYLEEAYEAGCRSLFVGFESISAENMRGNNKKVNVMTDYAGACRRFHDAGIMINGSFVFGFDHDGPDVFERTAEFAIENKILTATFHILTPLPGTRSFERLESQGRILHRDWDYYDTDHAVFRPLRMSPEELEAGHKEAYRLFGTYGSIFRRSTGLPGALKRLAYNIAWSKVDPLWVAIIRLGLMPGATRIFNRVLRWNTLGKSVGAGMTEVAVPSLGDDLVGIDRLEGVVVSGGSAERETVMLAGEKEV